MISETSIENWTTDVSHVIAAGAALVSFFAFIATAILAYHGRKHNKLSVMPYIDDWHHEADNHVYFYIKNKGLGPAFIDSFEFYLNGILLPLSEFQNEARSYANSVIKTSDLKVETSILNSTSVMSKDEKVVLLKIYAEDKFDTNLLSDSMLKDLRLKIKYRSFYNDIFVYDSAETRGW